MKDFSDKLAVVTGASSGIGQAIAVELASHGASVVLVGTNLQRLGETQKRCDDIGATAHMHQADVSDVVQMQGLADYVLSEIGVPDILVNNAGVVMSGLIHEVEPEDWQRLIAINVMGVVYGCRYFLPAMIERGQGGHVVNMASAAGLIGQPGMSTYCATKHAVVGMSASMRYELSGNNIGVTTICPGYVQTPIKDNLKLVGKLNTERVRNKVASDMKRNGLTAAQVARRTLKGIKNNEAFVTIGRDARAANLGRRFVPGLLDRAFRR